MYRPKIRIQIEGPGGVVDFEVKTVVDALTAIGCEVNLDAEYYEEPTQEWINKVKSEGRGTQVDIKVWSMPWGG